MPFPRFGLSDSVSTPPAYLYSKPEKEIWDRDQQRTDASQYGQRPMHAKVFVKWYRYLDLYQGRDQQIIFGMKQKNLDSLTMPPAATYLIKVTLANALAAYDS